MNDQDAKPYKRAVPKPFHNRWLIRGTFTTQSELHIGDGGERLIHNRNPPTEEEDLGRQQPTQDDESDASTVCVDHRDAAYIPGSSIKGPLRALVSDMDLTTQKSRIHDDWEALLGSDKPDGAGAAGGKLEFWDAFHSRGNGTTAEAFVPQPQNRTELLADRNRPWWDPKRRTCVAVSVSLDRRTRTAKENLLYHLEYVPVGETFAFEISGDNLGTDTPNEKEAKDIANVGASAGAGGEPTPNEEEIKAIARLLLLLDQFNTGEAVLGAQTSNGWGRVGCKVQEIRRLDATGLAGWKKNPQPGLAACQPVDAGTRSAIIQQLPPPVAQRVLESVGAAVKPPGQDPEKIVKLPGEISTLTIHLKLALESPWLIRDPRQRERSEAAKKLVDQKKISEADKPPDAVAIQNESGIPFVPAKSLRGVLRSRAEMILRTLGVVIPEHPGHKDNAVSTKGKGTKLALDEVGTKDLASRLFGFSGWQSPLDVPRLNLPEATPRPDDHHQEFVAIDRFTGGAADGAKFDADLAGATTLEGMLTLDLKRLELVDQEYAALGLLALVLRDLAEGDIPIGSGSAKGQGFCTADATVVEAGMTYHTLADWFRDSPLLETALPAFRSQIPQPSTAESHA